MSSKNMNAFFAGASGSNPLKKFPDGAYKFEIVKQDMRDAGESFIIEFELLPLSGPEGYPGGTTVKQSTWIKTQDNASNFIKILGKMGFDVDPWEAAGSQVKMTALAVRYMVGMNVECVKKDGHGNDGRTFHNLYLNGRCKDDEFADSKPFFIPNEELEAWAEDNPSLADAENVSF